MFVPDDVAALRAEVEKLSAAVANMATANEELVVEREHYRDLYLEALE